VPTTRLFAVRFEQVPDRQTDRSLLASHQFALE